MVTVLDFCLKHGFDKTYWIGYSGGLDSHVLLHLFSSLRANYPIKLKAIHIHHGLSPHADQWAEHCEQICLSLKIDFILRKISIPLLSGNSLEEMARQMRYAVFSELLSPDDLLLTAHHQNDQAETVLLQLLRGAGPKGLSAMPQFKKMGNGIHARPLLDYTREELQRYAEENHLKWIEDESNKNIHFSRNFLRQRVLPLLQDRWPSTINTLARVAENCSDVQQVMEDAIRQDLTEAVYENKLSIEFLKKLPLVRQRLVLREWLCRLDCQLPSNKKLNQILIDFLSAREDKLPMVQLNHLILRRYNGQIHVSKVDSDSFAQDIHWNLSEPKHIPGIGDLQVVTKKGQGLTSKIKEVTIRFRQGGEQCRLPGRKFHHSLKKLFQEWKVPPWERDRIPLVYVKEQLAAVVGYTICDGFEPDDTEYGFIIELTKI